MKRTFIRVLMLSIGALGHRNVLSRSRVAFISSYRKMFVSTCRNSRSVTQFRPFVNRRANTGYTHVARFMSSHGCEPTENETKMRADARAMIHAAIRAVDPYVAVRNRLRIKTDKATSPILYAKAQSGTELAYNLSNYDNIKIFSFGKASAAMALAAAEIAQKSSLPIEGTVIIKDDHATPDEIKLLQNCNITVQSASHPVPDGRSVSAANEILSSASSSHSNTLIIVCISGGGSALFCSPREPLTLQDLMQTNASLLKSGMPIDKMNIIRKRLENGKGGRLAAAAYPASVLTLILSDVIGDPLDLIASGPTVADGSDWGDACRIVEEYGLQQGGEHELPFEVLRLLQLGREEAVDDTPKRNNPAFSLNPATSLLYSENVLVGNNQAAVVAAADKAKQLGYHPVVLGTRVEGEASCVAGVYIAMAEMLSQQRDGAEVESTYQMGPLPMALIAGGETTVTLPPNSTGKGGRNQELALAAAIKMQEIGLRDVVLASVGTDGTDGPTDAAGAMVDGGTVNRIEEVNNSACLAKNALRNHDAYNFLNSGSHDSLIMTGPTGTNVADICITLVK